MRSNINHDARAQILMIHLEFSLNLSVLEIDLTLDSEHRTEFVVLHTYIST